MRLWWWTLVILSILGVACNREPTPTASPGAGPPATDRSHVTSIDPTPTCLGLTATLVGTEGNDLIEGTSGPDVIVALAGDDTVAGMGGNDVICGGDGNDDISGGSGDDRLHGQRGHDAVRGNQGSDRILGGRGDDTLSGGRGEDRILHGSPKGDDRIDGGAGADTVIDRIGNNTVAGAEGADWVEGTGVISGGPGPDSLVILREAAGFGGAGRDQITVHGKARSGDGGPGQDLIRFSPGEFPKGIRFDVGAGLLRQGKWRMTFTGFERHHGTNGPDIFFGSNGNDWLAGRKGDDTVNGRSGVDVCRGFEIVKNCETVA